MKKKIKTIIGLVTLLAVSSCASTGTSSFLFSFSGHNPWSSHSSTNYSSTNDSSTSDSSSSDSSSSDSTCVNHDFVYAGDIPATIIENGKRAFQCKKCDFLEFRDIFLLDECAFVNQTFAYDGTAHSLTVQGLIPLGVTVEYENNVLTAIGQKQATAHYYDANRQLLKQETAIIKVVDNDGFSDIFVNTQGIKIDEEDKENYTEMTLTLSNCPDKYLLSNAPGGIRVRGNGSLTYEKKGYRIKFDAKRSMLGLNDEIKAKSWVLLAEYSDQSMFRSISALFLGNALLNYSGNYASSYQHINLYINNEYLGVYLLAEQQQANDERIDINEPEENYKGTDVGYLLELDNYATEEDNYFAVGGLWDSIKNVYYGKKNYSIKSDIYDKVAQTEYIKKYLSNLYNAFFSLIKAIKDNKPYVLKVLDQNFELVTSPYTTVYETLNSMIDLDSLFRVYLLHEMMKNLDVGYSSFYMFVDFSLDSKHPRLTFGAPWDFDWSSGNVNIDAVSSTNGLFCSTSFDYYRFNPWFGLLSNTDFFSAMFKKYYMVFDHSEIFENLVAYLNYEATAFVEEFGRNYHRWTNLGTLVPKYTPNIATTFKAHRDAANQLIQWLTSRKTFLDSVYLV